MLKAIFRLFSFILVVLIVFAWASLAAFALLIALMLLITKIPSKDKQIKRRAKEIIQQGSPQSREKY